MFKANQSATIKNAEYAVAGDFCQIFDQDMSSLCLLALLRAILGSQGDRSKCAENHQSASQCRKWVLGPGLN